MYQKSYVLIDFSNLVYISFFATYRGEPTQVPRGYNAHVDTFQKMIRGYRRWNGLAEFVYALDSRPEEKYRLHPGYKAGRSKLSHDDGSYFDAQIPIKKNLTDETTVIASGYEADDAIASFVAQHFEDEVTVVTTDKDIWPINDHPNARVYDPIKRQYINENHLRESFCRKDKHKVIHEHLTDYAHIKLWKSLWGDSGDSVPNVVPRMQKQLLPVIAKTDGSLEDFYDKVEDAKISAKCKELLESSKEKVLLNDKLVRLNYRCVLEHAKFEPAIEDSGEGIPWDENGNPDTSLLEDLF